MKDESRKRPEPGTVKSLPLEQDLNKIARLMSERKILNRI